MLNISGVEESAVMILLEQSGHLRIQQVLQNVKMSKKSMFALFHLDAVLVIPFAGEGEEEIGMLPSKHAEPVLVAESQFHLVPKIGFVLK